SPLSRIAVGVRRTVSSFKTDLMRSMARRPVYEEILVERNAAILANVELDHPAVDTFRIELRIDGAIQGIGEIHALPVTADLDHLGTPVERTVLGFRMRGARDDAAYAHPSCLLRVEGVGNIVLDHVAGSPARDVEEAVVHRKVDISDEGCDR